MKYIRKKIACNKNKIEYFATMQKVEKYENSKNGIYHHSLVQVKWAALYAEFRCDNSLLHSEYSMFVFCGFYVLHSYKILFINTQKPFEDHIFACKIYSKKNIYVTSCLIRSETYL